jgi:hypothetical protein
MVSRKNLRMHTWRNQLIHHVYKETRYPKYAVHDIVLETLQVIVRLLANGYRVQLDPLGIFQPWDPTTRYQDHTWLVPSSGLRMATKIGWRRAKDHELKAKTARLFGLTEEDLHGKIWGGHRPKKTEKNKRSTRKEKP